MRIEEYPCLTIVLLLCHIMKMEIVFFFFITSNMFTDTSVRIMAHYFVDVNT